MCGDSPCQCPFIDSPPCSYCTNKSSRDFKIARGIMANTFDKDPDFERVYIANIAMLLYDNYGITDIDKRTQAGKDIVNLVFRS